MLASIYSHVNFKRLMASSACLKHVRDRSQLWQIDSKYIGQNGFKRPVGCLCRLPLTQTSKVQRVNMGKRLGLQEISDATLELRRLFEAQCPPGPSDVHQPIPCNPVSISQGEIR